MNKEYFASINEVSKRLSVPAYTLRYWEKQFPSAVCPTTGTGGHRYYRTETVNRLIVIKELLYSRGMTIAGIKKLLHEGKFPKTIGILTAAEETQSKQAISEPGQINQNEREKIKSAIDILKQAKKILSA